MKLTKISAGNYTAIVNGVDIEITHLYSNVWVWCKKGTYSYENTYTTRIAALEAAEEWIGSEEEAQANAYKKDSLNPEYSAIDAITPTDEDIAIVAPLAALLESMSGPVSASPEKTQYVLRIEHPESKQGPYVHNCGAIMPFTPGPAMVINCDLLDKNAFSRSLVCGVEYMSHIYLWFGVSLQYLYDAGFRLYMYLLPVDKVLRTKSGLQVAFNKADAIEVQEIA